MNELRNCEVVLINRERAMLAITGKHPLSVASLFPRQVGWQQVGPLVEGRLANVDLRTKSLVSQLGHKISCS